MLTDFFVGFGLDLTYALAGDIELTADFFESMLDAVLKTTAHLQNFAFLFGQFIQDFLDLIAQNAARAFLIGRENLVVGDKVAESRFAVIGIIANRHFQRAYRLIYLFNVIYFGHFDA